MARIRTRPRPAYQPRVVLTLGLTAARRYALSPRLASGGLRGRVIDRGDCRSRSDLPSWLPASEPPGQITISPGPPDVRLSPWSHVI